VDDGLQDAKSAFLALSRLHRKEEEMPYYQQTDYRGRTVRDARGVISQNLDTVESGVDIAIDTAKEAVHEFRGKAQEIAGETVSQMQRTWNKKRPKIERHMDTHLGLCLERFFFSHTSFRESEEKK
jgi:hypothetical protein